MADIGAALMFPVVVIFCGVLDYAMWPPFEALAGRWAMGWMFLLIIAEIALLAKFLASL